MKLYSDTLWLIDDVMRNRTGSYDYWAIGLLGHRLIDDVMR